MSVHHETKRGVDILVDYFTSKDAPSDPLGGIHQHTSAEAEHGVAAECDVGQVKAARIEFRAQVARQALANVALLSKDEEDFVLTVPLGESRYKAIVDAFTVYAAREISGL